MKTSELFKKLQEFKVDMRINNFRYLAVYESREEFSTVDIKERFLNLSPSCPRDIAELLFDYYLTPLKEREEEKKYYLKLNKYFSDNNGVYVNFNINNKRYDFNNEHELFSVKTQFTKKEIDDMPFDTSFFIKEEVK